MSALLWLDMQYAVSKHDPATSPLHDVTTGAPRENGPVDGLTGDSAA